MLAVRVTVYIFITIIFLFYYFVRKPVKTSDKVV